MDEEVTPMEQDLLDKKKILEMSMFTISAQLFGLNHELDNVNNELRMVQNSRRVFHAYNQNMSGNPNTDGSGQVSN